MTPKVNQNAYMKQATKEKVGKLDYIELKTCASKDTINVCSHPNSLAVYTLNMYSLSQVSHTSMKWLKKSKSH